jgi:hypothetical protein
MKYLASLIALAAVTLAPLAAQSSNPANGITQSGQQLTVTLNTPTVVDEFMVGNPVLADCLATLGPASSQPVNIVYVIDVSGSAGGGGNDVNPPMGIGPEDDANGDGSFGQIIDAELFGVIAVNQSLGNSPNVEVGVVAFGSGANFADVSPLPGIQGFLSNPQADLNMNGTPDLEEVAASIDIGQVGGFTPQGGVGTGTDFNDALTAMNNLFATQPAGEVNIAIFLTDGQSSLATGPGSPLALAVSAGTIINTFGIGPGAAGLCDPGEPLDIIASMTNGSCNEVQDPATLAQSLPGATSTEISTLELKVNGNVVATANGPEAVSLAGAPFDIEPFLNPGNNTVECCATAADGTVVTASENVALALCMMMVGVSPITATYGLDAKDVLVVDPLWFYPMTLQQMPDFTIPNISALNGFKIYFQGLIYNEQVFPTDPLKFSWGLEIEIGVGTNYRPGGAFAGIQIYPPGNGVVNPGDTFQVPFTLVGF